MPLRAQRLSERQPLGYRFMAFMRIMIPAVDFPARSAPRREIAFGFLLHDLHALHGWCC